MKPHVIFFCTSCLFGYEPRDLSSRLTTELEWEKAQMLRSWAPIGPLTWPWGPRPGSMIPPGDHASQPNAFKAWNSPQPLFYSHSHIWDHHMHALYISWANIPIPGLQFSRENHKCNVYGAWGGGKTLRVHCDSSKYDSLCKTTSLFFVNRCYTKRVSDCGYVQNIILAYYTSCFCKYTVCAMHSTMVTSKLTATIMCETFVICEWTNTITEQNEQVN